MYLWNFRWQEGQLASIWKHAIVGHTQQTYSFACGDKWDCYHNISGW